MTPTVARARADRPVVGHGRGRHAVRGRRAASRLGGLGGRGPGARRRGTATASAPATPTTSPCWPSTASATTASPSSGPASSPGPAGGTTTRSPTCAGCWTRPPRRGVDAVGVPAPRIGARAGSPTTSGAGSTTRRVLTWARHVDRVAEAIGDLVAGWVPIHEPELAARLGYGDGTFPPGRRNDDDHHDARAALLAAEAEAARLLRSGPAPGGGRRRAAASRHESDDLVVVSAPVDDLERAARARRPTTRPTPASSWSPATPPPGTAPRRRSAGRRRRRSARGRGGRAPGDPPGRAVTAVREAQAGGLAIVGAFHQPAVDGYEWHRGFDARLGLFDRDREPPRRRPRPCRRPPPPDLRHVGTVRPMDTDAGPEDVADARAVPRDRSTSRRTPRGRTPPSASAAGRATSPPAPRRWARCRPSVVIATFYNFNPEIVRAAIPAAWYGGVTGRPRRGPSRRHRPRPARGAGRRRRRLARGGGGGHAGPPRRREGARPRAGRSSPPTPSSPGPTNRTWPCGTRSRSCASSGATGTSPPWSPRVSTGARRWSRTAPPAAASRPRAILQATRGWSDDAWAAAGDRLRDRGLLDDDDALTPAGVTVRDRVEQVTDDRAMAPWRHLGEDDADRLRTLVRPFSKAVAASGAFRAGPAS